MEKRTSSRYLDYMSQEWQDKVSQTSVTEEQSAESIPSVVLLVTGEDMDGHSQWAYVKVTLDQYTKFKLAEKSGSYSLADYGQILAFGKGEKPSRYIRQEMKEKYDCDNQFAEAMFKEMENIIACWQTILLDGLASDTK